MKKRVIFSTTVFDEVNTGPGVYAQYLWQAFRDDQEIEFHVVAASFKEQHRRLHPVGSTENSAQLYHRVAQKTLELTKGREKETIVHGNAAHAMSDFADYSGAWMVQVNDYEVATLWRHSLETLCRSGPRRLVSLGWRHQQEKKVIPAATRVVCNSQFTRRKVLETYRVDEKKCITIYKAVETSEFMRPAELPPDILANRPKGARLAFMGANWQIKGLDTLLKALHKLANSNPDVTLVVAGNKEVPSNRKAKKLCSRLGLDDCVFFVGRVDHSKLGNYLWHSDIFVLPSLQEGLGVSVIEAMAAGLPVVATHVGGIPEIIRSETEGILCRPNNSGELAEAIRKLLSNEQLRSRLSLAGPKRAKKFNTDQMIKAVRNMYLELFG